MSMAQLRCVAASAARRRVGATHWGLTLRTFSRSASAVYRYSIQHRKICTPTMKGGVSVKASCAWLRNWALCSPRDSDAPMTNIMTPILSRKAWYSSFNRMLSFLCPDRNLLTCHGPWYTSNRQRLLFMMFIDANAAFCT